MKAYRFTRRLAVAAVCAISVLAAPAFAQAQTREAALLQRVQVEPTDLGAILELVRLYEVERRCDDALRMLTRAMSVVHEKRAAAATTTQKSVVIESPRVPAMGAGAAAQEPPGGQAALTQVPVRVGGAVLEPRKIRDVKPVFCRRSSGRRSGCRHPRSHHRRGRLGAERQDPAVGAHAGPGGLRRGQSVAVHADAAQRPARARGDDDDGQLLAGDAGEIRAFNRSSAIGHRPSATRVIGHRTIGRWPMTDDAPMADDR